ncbi:acyl carrier protein [Ranunculus cassubicifolius]
MAAATLTSISFRPSSAQQINTPTTTRFSSLKSVSLPAQRIKFPSLKVQPVCSRISCAAKRETVDKVGKVIREQLGLPAVGLQPYPADMSITAESELSSLGADSLDTVEIVMELEDAFGINVEEESIFSIATVQDAADMIEELLEKA